VWLFPPRSHGGRESGVAVLSSFAAGDAGARTIHTVHYDTAPQPGGTPLRRDEVVEQGTVPVDRVDRIIDGVLRRLERPETPAVREVGGDASTWERVLGELRGDPEPPQVDGSNRESLSSAMSPDAANHGGS
jgi:hypothetical protein